MNRRQFFATCAAICGVAVVTPKPKPPISNFLIFVSPEWDQQMMPQQSIEIDQIVVLTDRERLRRYADLANQQ